jgi:Ca-activated chloride channel family protein
MTDIVFLQPAFAWTLPAAAAGWWIWRLARRRRFVGSTVVGWLDPARYRASPIRRLPAALIVAALGLVSIALMDPVLPRSEGQLQSLGLDIVLVVDLSSSMQEIMGRPAPAGRTRLETTKDALREFISRRRDDRIGLVVFSDHAYVISPLTFDFEYLLNYVDIVDDRILRGEGMTAIGDGIGLANYLLARQSTDRRRNKVTVVFTDGEHNFGRDPLEALAESEAAGIRVHVVGVDLEEDVKRKPGVRQLIRTVQSQGGRYFNADSVRELRAASAAIDSLEKGLLTSKISVRNAPVFTWFALPAAALIVLALALRAAPYFADFT